MIPNRRAGCYCPSPGPPPLTTERPNDVRETLDLMIVQQWVKTLSGPFDWASWPLARYTISDEFHDQVEHRRSLDDVAWACAMLACGLAHELCELDLQPRSAGPRARPLVRDDGAKGYSCTILAGRSAGSRLHLWRLPSGLIEFESFTGVKLMRPPTGPD